MSEKNQTGKSLREMELDKIEELKKELENRKQRIFDMGLEINQKIVKRSKKLEKITSEISKKTKIWLERLRNYYVKEDRKTSEILDFADVDEKKISCLQNDLFLILKGLDSDKGYVSYFVALKEIAEQYHTDLNKQRKRTAKEMKKRKELEEKVEARIKRMEKMAGETEKDLNKLSSYAKELKSSVENKEEANKRLKGFINSIFDPRFRLYLLKEISKLGIPNINLGWDDEGIDYVFSSDILYLNRDDDVLKNFLEIVKSETEGKPTKLTDIRVREQYNQLLEDLSKYMRDPNHVTNLEKLKKNTSKAMQAFNSRKRKDLVWCGDYSKNCSFVCPGFTPTETYCNLDKNSTYDTRRLDLLSALISDVYVNLEIVIGLEKRLRKKNK